MKLSKQINLDVVAPEKWKNYDGCPVCKILKRAAEEGRRLSKKEFEEAFREASEIENNPD